MALSNKKIREMIAEKFGDSGQADISEILALFDSKTGGSTGEKSSVEYNGEIIGKKDAKTGLYYSADCFTARAQSSDGLSYYTKATQSALSKLRRAKAQAKEEADAALRKKEITVDEWNAKLDEIDAMTIDTEALSVGGYSSPDELIAAYEAGELVCPTVNEEEGEEAPAEEA